MSLSKRRYGFVFLVSVLVVLIASPALAATVNAKANPQKGSRGARHAVKEQAPHVKGRERQSTLAAFRRARAAEMRRIEARRRAEAARQAAIARQRALDDKMRDEVQTMIGRDNTAGEDMQVRRAAIDALGNHAGTVVVMDPMTGRVYSVVNQEWALRRGFKPCSTIKLVTGVAGLNENIIDEPASATTTKVSAGYHINLTDALAYSNNAYFQEVGGRVGFEKMISYARRLGLGEKTGINAPNEFQGQVPAAKSGFAVNHMSSHGDDFQVTALQLATLVSAMANGGKLLSPRVPRPSQDEAKIKPQVRRQLNLDVATLQSMVPGMIGSVSYGSGRRAQDPRETVAGKTGTCIEHGTWVGLFASYAPVLNPRLAVVVIARGTDAHGHFPAAVAGRIYRDLNSRFGTPTDLQIATTRDMGAPSEKGNRIRDPKAALDEEGEDEATAEADETNDDGANQDRRVANATLAKTPRPLTSTPTNGNVRLVLMPITVRTQQNGTATTPKPAVQTVSRLLQRPRRVSDRKQ